MNLLYSLAHPTTTPPARMTPGAAGWDLTVDEPVTIPAGGTTTTTTGVAVAIPQGMVGEVHIRSSLGIKHGISLANGTGIIDSDFRGEILLGLRNNSPHRIDLPRGARVAQLLIKKVEHPTLIEVAELPETERGTGGIGSTGQ